MEDKQLICDKLVEVLKETRGGSDISSIKYDEQEDVVYIVYVNNYRKRVNVAIDSGIAMIRDIMRNVE